MDTATFHKLLIMAVQKGASDIHLQADAMPLLRINGELLEMKYHLLTPAETRMVAQEILSQTIQQNALETLSELDVSYSLEGYGRFRANIFRQKGSFGIVLRVIPITIKSFGELNLPPVLAKISDVRRGLVLVVGATGNGKSTTLASMVEHINSTRRVHIITIEDPIEFLFKNNKSLVCQREIGVDTPTFARATVAAMRQDPNVLFIGEIREAETVDVALKAAETGHLVLTSLHTSDCVSSLARLIGFFPPNQDAAVRKRLSDCIVAIIALRLLPMKGAMGRIPAVEVLRVTRTIQECIRDASKTGDIPHHLEQGADLYEMQTFDTHLRSLVRENLVDLETAKLAANNPEDLVRSILLE